MVWSKKNWAYLFYVCSLFYRRFIRKMTICQNYSLNLKKVKVAIPGDSWIKNILKLTFGINKFEVSKIYMTACMCIYKFCQTKEYLFMIFFCFIQKPEGYFYDSSWFFMFYSRSWMFYYMYLKKYSCFITFKKIYSRFFKIFHVLFKILNDIHVLSLIFMKYSRFFKIIYVLLKILNDFLFMYFIH